MPILSWARGELVAVAAVVKWPLAPAVCARWSASCLCNVGAQSHERTQAMRAMTPLLIAGVISSSLALALSVLYWRANVAELGVATRAA